MSVSTFGDPVCGREFRTYTCMESGEHLCEARSEHIRCFFAEMLVHTKGKYAGHPFILEDWQFLDIVKPLFGTVVWSDENGCYVRRYRRAWIEIARKNGKSEILAGIMLYLLVADGEESAELYGCARNRRQAALVFDVAKRMIQLSPKLSKLLKPLDNVKKIKMPATNGLYEAIPADEDTALGSNPSGVAADEMLAWRSRGMWDALETGMGSGARLNPLMVAATTAGATGETGEKAFAEDMHKAMLRFEEHPELSPHTFVYIRNTPPDADPWDEATWYIANPALGSFLSLESMRQAALDAQSDPKAEQAFRQFRLNQWTKGTFRWMDMARYDLATRTIMQNPAEPPKNLAGQMCFMGVDLSAKMDLSSVCLLFPFTADGPTLLWRHYAPEEAVRVLDQHNDGMFGRFVEQGWLTQHEGSVIDYDALIEDMRVDAGRYQIMGMDADEWSMWSVIEKMAKVMHLSTDTEVLAYKCTFTTMTPGMGHLMELVKTGRMNHLGNPLARYCFEATEVKTSLVDPNQIRPYKPQRDKEWTRIDAVPSAAMAANAWKTRGEKLKRKSVYATRGVAVA